MFTVSISTNGAAFEGNSAPEIARILSELARKIESEGVPGDASYKLHDINGNTVGHAYGGQED